MIKIAFLSLIHGAKIRNRLNIINKGNKYRGKRNNNVEEVNNPAIANGNI
jgi:hypothetical protein